LETVLNLAQVHVFFVATILSEIQETELKPFLTIFGTDMRAKIIQNHHNPALAKETTNQMRTDETSPTRHQNIQ
jgi:hypothetical protein